MVADRKPTRAQLRKKYGVSEKWDELFKLIPKYDCYAQAEGCYFDEKAAEHVCEFFEVYLRHPAETTAVPAGSPFILRPWQQAHIGGFFGWKKKANGKRRYRKIFIYVGKKTGKSSETAGVIPYVMTQEEGSMMRLCAVAASRDQTTNVFDPLVEMIRKAPGLANVLKVYGGTVGGQMKSVVYPEKNHRLICLAADAGTADGKPAKAAFVDELHRFPNGEMYEVAERNTSAQAEPIVWVTTTADWQRDSPCNRELAFAHAVQKNKGDPDAPGWAPWYLPVVYETTEKDDYKDPKTWHKANPNLGYTVTEEYMADMVREAKDDPAKLNMLLRLYMNRVTRSEVTWLPDGAWDKCYDKDIHIEDLCGQQCWGGIDLGSTSDMTVLVLLFPLDDGRVFLWSHFWVPDTLTKEGSHKNWDNYASWVRAGHMTATPTNPGEPGGGTDYGFIRARLEELAGQYGIRELAFDRSWGMVHVAQELGEDGHKTMAFNQSTAAITPFAKQFYTWVTTRKIAHDGNPVHAWQAGHVMVQCNAYDGVRPIKPSPEAKIDAIVCDIMALGAWQAAEPESEPELLVVY